jgi:hypothetical protein
MNIIFFKYKFPIHLNKSINRNIPPPIISHQIHSKERIFKVVSINLSVILATFVPTSTVLSTIFLDVSTIYDGNLSICKNLCIGPAIGLLYKYVSQKLKAFCIIYIMQNK